MKSMLKAIAMLGCLGAMPAAAQEDTSWFPSKYGQDDELGAANLLTPALALKAAVL